MIEINFKGQNLFTYVDNNSIQIVGIDEKKKRLIIDIYLKILNGYKFTETDMEAMDGYYPEIKNKDVSLKKNDILAIKLSNIEDMYEHLKLSKSSIIFKYLISLKNEIDIVKELENIEEDLLTLCLRIDDIIKYKISNKSVSFKTDIISIDFKNIIKSFIDINYVDQNEDSIPLWLLNEKQIIDLFLDILILIIEKNEDITLIIDGLDVKIGIDEYNYFVNKLYTLTKEYSNFRIWTVPKTVGGIFLDYDIFSNTYILNEKNNSLGDFITTYDSVCRNYPDNNVPSKKEVLEAILEFFPFHKESKTYPLNKKTVIFKIFLFLLNGEGINIEDNQLSKLEDKFLTALNV